LADFAPPTFSYVYGKNNPAVNNRTFVVMGDSWAKDGKPFRILSGKRKIFLKMKLKFSIVQALSIILDHFLNYGWID
jgi:hypothetical protein